ncbi:MAG: PAS domain S-box protein, partial [Chloroflexota bacterium]|nr:PAS domain S-box protein [Chloroflexota bacterium]
MTLRKRTLTIIGVTFIGLIVILYAASQAILLDSFTDLEEQNTRQQVERVINVWAGELSALDAIAYDWAAWDDTYAFIENANEDYISSNLTDSTFSGLRLNHMLFINSSGQVVFGKSFDLLNEQEIPVPQSLQTHFSSNSLLLRHPDAKSSTTGIVTLPEGPMLVASRPILTSDDEGPIRGTLIMGRYLDPAEIERLAGTAGLSLTMRRFDDAESPPDFQTAFASLSDKTPMTVRPLDSQSVAGYALLEDIYGNPALVLRADMPRNIYEQGRTSISYLILALLATGVVSGVVAVLLLEKHVLSRLTRLSESVSSIGASADLSRRVPITGNDELSSLAHTINGMLQALERPQEALQKSEEKYRLLFESSPETIMLIGLDGTVLDCNRTTTQITGLPQEEMIGRQVLALDILHEEDVSKYIKLISQAAAGEKMDSFELRMLCNSHEIRWIEVFPSLLERDNREGAVQIIARDITERKQAEKELRESERRFRTIFENANDVIVYVNKQGQIVAANRRIENVFGYKRDEVIGKHFVQLGFLRVGDVPKMVKLFKGVVENGRVVDTTGTGVNVTELEIEHKNGDIAFAEVSTTTVTREGRVEGFLNIIRDVTERKRAEEALRQSEEHFRSLIENALDFIAILNDDGTISYLSPSVERALGFKP